MSYSHTNELGDRLSIRVVVGSDGHGHPILRSRSYSNVKPEVSDEDLYEFAEKVVGLINYSGAEDVQRYVGKALMPGMLTGGAI